MGLRNCEIAQQLEYMPGYPDEWEKTLKENLQNHEHIINWCFAVHDMDTDENDNPKKTHVHIVLALNESLDPSTIGGYVGVPKNFVERIKQKKRVGNRMVADIGGAISYLTHRNAPEKYQYDDGIVVAKPGFDWKALRAKSEAEQAAEKSYKNALEKIENGDIRRFNLMNYIGMKTYIAHKTDFDRAFEYRETKLKVDANRELEVIYICGDSETGKSTLAKQICEKRGVSYLFSGSSRDPFQDYGGQDAIILDELRAETFSLSDLLKILDNHSASSVSARYHDRWLEVKLIIITSVFSVQNFFNQYYMPCEPIEQLMRRCSKVIRLTPTEMYIYSYDSEKHNYRLLGKGANPITPQFLKNTSEQEKKLADFCAEMGVSYIERESNEKS